MMKELYLVTGADFFGVFVLLIILYGNTFENSGKGLLKTLFSVLVCCGIAGLCLDGCGWMMDGRGFNESIMFVVNYFTLILTEVMATVFGYYVVTYINKVDGKNSLSYIHAHISLLLNIASVGFTTVTSLTGRMFVISGGYFVYSDLYDYMGFGATLSMTYFAVLILTQCKKLGIHDTVALFLYLLFPLLGSIIEAQWHFFPVTYASICLSLVLIFVMLQSKAIQQGKLREKLLSDISLTDMMTGLPNRRAYDDAIRELGKKDNIGVIFCDVNGLKQVNDTRGHVAGDEWICRFARILEKHLEEGSVFRISGDEFVVLKEIKGQEDFLLEVEELRKDIAANDHIASVGSVTGSGGDVIRLIKEAEHGMYADKREYYQRSGFDRRRR